MTSSMEFSIIRVAHKLFEYFEWTLDYLIVVDFKFDKFRYLKELFDFIEF